MKVTYNQYHNDNNEDIDLIVQANAGNSQALDSLIKKYQVWIYNIALKMLGRPEDAEDATQEILIKMVTHLSTFEQKSSFRTWLYRIVANHTLNMKRKAWERLNSSFEKHKALMESLQDTNPTHSPVENLLVEETKIACMTGMLLCLNRKQRLVLILSLVCGIDSQQGANIMETNPDNFRQLLSRGRKQLKNFMMDNCGLFNDDNPCRCSNKTCMAIEKGIVNPKTLQIKVQPYQKIQRFIAKNLPLVDDMLELNVHNLYQELPIMPSPDFSKHIQRIIKNKKINQFIHLTEENG